MKVLGYYNGVCGPLEEMTVPMNDRACYFGDGVYEAAMARNGVIFGLDEHMDRLFNSAGLLDIQIPYTKKELADILYAVSYTHLFSNSFHLSLSNFILTTTLHVSILNS